MAGILRHFALVTVTQQAGTCPGYSFFSMDSNIPSIEFSFSFWNRLGNVVGDIINYRLLDILEERRSYKENFSFIFNLNNKSKSHYCKGNFNWLA